MSPESENEILRNHPLTGFVTALNSYLNFRSNIPILTHEYVYCDRNDCDSDKKFLSWNGKAIMGQ